ncbi:MAG TPA: cytochrome c [Verrucomicrobiae bacterium]|nr:cytochrome c [Verrucomicrobiae bacterium]
MTRRRGIAVILCVAVCAGIGAHLAWRRAAEKSHRRREQARMTGNGVKTNSAPLAPAGMYLDTNKLVFANFGTQDPALQAYIKALMDGSYDTRAKGRAIFIKICAACHQPDGMGKDGVGPPLVGSEWVLASDGNRLVRIVLNGLSGPVQVEGRQWNLVMPPWRENLRDDQIAVVLTYIRSNLGTNKAGPIRQELVSAAREESHPKPETAKELLEISE